MRRTKATYIFQFLIIAALYAGITIAEQFTVGMTKDIIQVRLSDALTVLPVFTPAAIPGLFAGCMVSNYVIGCQTYDVIFGSLATLVGATGTYLVRKHRFMAPVPPIIINMITIPLLFTYVYRYEDSFWYYVIAIGIGQIIACGILGMALMLGLEDHKDKLFPSGVTLTAGENDMKKETDETVSDDIKESITGE